MTAAPEGLALEGSEGLPAIPEGSPVVLSSMPSAADLDNMARMCKIIAGSDMVPRAFQRSPSNVFVALLVARRMDEDPITLMQNMYILHGKPAFTASYMIARANRSGCLSGGVQWSSEGTGADLVVTAYATRADTGDRIAASVSMATAKAENWTKNPKYRTMGETMLRYRSATMLIRQYLPEVMLDYDVTEPDEPAPRQVTRGRRRAVPAVPLPDDGPIAWEGEIVEPAEGGESCGD